MNYDSNISEQWRLFSDSSKVSLKTVLLHNGNQLPSIPLTQAVHMKEMYEIFQVLLEKICYKYADLKVIAMLTVLQGS
jgi:hypothetical protein